MEDTFEAKYLKYKQKYLNCKNSLQNTQNNLQYKTKYIETVYEKQPCGNVLERIFTDKIKCTKDQYCNCGECKSKKSSDSECKHDTECVSKNCDYDPVTKTGKCSSKTSLLQQLFIE